jgi:tetratricopeptide (TPR) repeat protein
MELALADQHQLRAAVGWLELGNATEALVELDQLPAAAQAHADVLEIRWLALAERRDWDAANKIGHALISAAPERASSWLHHAYALRRAPGGGLMAAFNALASVADKFPAETTLTYNLACYCCQMERDPAETLKWLRRALACGEPKAILAMALQDPDLVPLRDMIAGLAKPA